METKSLYGYQIIMKLYYEQETNTTQPHAVAHRGYGTTFASGHRQRSGLDEERPTWHRF